MATLTEELNKFHTARYGEDVRDAFVACIEKIHAENVSVTQLRSEMQAAADQFGIKEQALEAKLQTALNDYLAKYNSVKSRSGSLRKRRQTRPKRRPLMRISPQTRR